MKSILFTYSTQLGSFWIRPEPAGRVRLGFEQNQLRTYPTPRAAAQAVAEQKTGYEPWDSGEHALIPTDLTKWKTGAGYAASRKRQAQRGADQLADLERE